ncbi:hypothetical protein QMT40_001798 [Parvibaculaceae bacterium PLY_AMNH_Bact1]|nr:hypothetical protein QMT40_001798 [Parvibaculaceae bacterium PLY_AMNH_Bact1]
MGRALEALLGLVAGLILGLAYLTLFLVLVCALIPCVPLYFLIDAIEQSRPPEEQG